jgi:hypothetical protein
MGLPQDDLRSTYDELQVAKKVLACFEGLEGKNSEEIVAEIRTVVDDFELVLAPKRRSGTSVGYVGGWQADMARAYYLKHASDLDRVKDKLKKYKKTYQKEISLAKVNEKQEDAPQPGNGQ